MKLRQYQIEAKNALRNSFRAGNKHVILCAPTGAGKTVIFSSMVYDAMQRGKKTLIVTDRIELLTQSGGALNRNAIEPENITANSKPNLKKQCFVGMVETISRRVSKPEYVEWIKSIDLIIFDEAHKQAFNKLFSYISESTYVIGATATPHRDKNQSCLSEFYSDIVEVITIPELINLGYLASPRSFHYEVDLKGIKIVQGDYDAQAQAEAYEKQQVYKGVINNYKKYCDGVKTLCFAPCIDASKQVLNEFLANGYPAKHLDSYMDKSIREEILNWYAETPNAILCNVGILTTGFDSPETECIILYRATKSKPLFLQMVGRGGRVTETKKEFFVLDFGSNIKTHGLWEADRVWGLKKSKGKDGSAPVKECPECGYLLNVSVMECPECGHIFETKEKELTQKEVELIEIAKAKEVAKYKPKKDILKMPLNDVVIHVKAGTIKVSYVIYNLFALYSDALSFTRKLGYKDGWLWHQTKLGNFQHLQK